MNSLPSDARPIIPRITEANWIASPVVGGIRTSAPAPYFRRGFTIDQSVVSAILTITALGLYDCEINGARVGDEAFAPGWTDYKKRVQYQCFEIKEMLRPGENVIGVILGDGWYCGHVGWWPRQHYGTRPHLLAQISIQFEDSRTINLVTDSNWKTTSGPILKADMIMGEHYDARLELGAWSRPGYDEVSWQTAIESPPAPLPELSERLGPPVRRTGEIAPVSIRVINSWCRIVDFGQNFTGRVRIRLSSKKGTTACLRFGEMLNPDGRLYTENLRKAECTDYYTSNGEDSTWEPRFTFHGFRYVEITDLAEDDTLEMTGIILHSDTPVTGSFRCSNELLNQLQHNIVWGQKSNFLDVPTDCPQRDERLGWTGDAQVFVRTAAFNMDVSGFFRKWMRDCRDAQSAAGGMPPIVPDMPFGIEDGGPGWSDAIVICPWTIYLCYGDRSILAENYESMRRWLDFIYRSRCKGLIRGHFEVDNWGGFGDWLALDGSGKNEGLTARDLIGTAFFAHSTGLLGRISAVLDQVEEAARYRALHLEIVEAFRRRFVTADGVLISSTQTAYVLALKFGLIPEEVRGTSVRELVRLIELANFHIGTGFLGTPYLLDVLAENGHLGLAYKLLEQETFPSWLFPIKHGATTIWERWDGWTPEKGFQDKGMNSFNHYAYGAVGAWMVGTLAGLEIDSDHPGYQHVCFKPRPGGTITWAEAAIKTSRGLVRIHWHLKDGQELTVELEVPEDVSATFEPPPSHLGHLKAFGSGVHRFSLPKNMHTQG